MPGDFVTDYISIEGSECPDSEFQTISSVQIRDNWNEFDLEFKGQLDPKEICIQLRSLLKFCKDGHLKIQFRSFDN